MAKYKWLYEVRFYITKGCGTKCLKWYEIHIDAYNQKEAIAEAKELWYEGGDAHMFRLTARRCPLDEIVDVKHWFDVVETVRW